MSAGKERKKFWQDDKSLASKWYSPLEYRLMKRKRKQYDEDAKSLEAWARSGFQSGGDNWND